MKANLSFEPEVTLRRDDAPSRLDPFRSQAIRRRIEVLHSWMLVAESKRLLLCLLERRMQRSPGSEDPAAMERLRDELDLAKKRCRVKRTAAAASVISSAQLENTYKTLIRSATRTVAKLTNSAPMLSAADRVNAAVGVQMLDELLDEWRKAAGDVAVAGKLVAGAGGERLA